jgi:putative FmdB family regulatory protein
MPIYAYRCASCGHAKDVLQKMSDPVLITCPACGTDAFKKQVTAAGFQLKGSGWYFTDFKGGAGAGAAATGAVAPASDAAATPPASAPASGTDSGGTSSASSGGDTAAGGCGSSCACH